MARATFTDLPQPQRREEVEHVLRTLSDGGCSADELESAVVDIKEGPGRRAGDGSVLHGCDDHAVGIDHVDQCRHGIHPRQV